jgi:hypothetical protein
MKMIGLLTSAALMSAAAMSWAFAQNTVGSATPSLPAQLPASISEGSYGPGFYGQGLTGPGSSGAGSYGPGFYGPGAGASTGPATPFSPFLMGGPAAGTSAVPSARSQ